MPEFNSTVTVLPSAAAAGVVREQLEAAGIASAIVEAGGTFQLQVAEQDFPRAMQLLFPIPSAEMAAAILSGKAAPWKCAHCGEEVQPTSDVCWSCGQPKAGAAAALPPKISPPAPPAFPYPPAPAVELPPAPAIEMPPNREANASRSPAAPQKRPVRTPAAEEPNPWKNPWLIGIWAFLGLAVCLIAWLALR